MGEDAPREPSAPAEHAAAFERFRDGIHGDSNGGATESLF
jgi:hypothetical protein